MKQQRINTFLLGLADFIEKYYSEEVNDVRSEEVDEWIKVTISGNEESVLELWSEGSEVTVIFSESHWHIDDYNTPCNMNSIYSQTIHSVLAVLDGELVTYSCWIGERCKGGGSFNPGEMQALDKANKVFSDFDTIKIKCWGHALETIKNTTGEQK